MISRVQRDNLDSDRVGFGGLEGMAIRNIACAGALLLAACTTTNNGPTYPNQVSVGAPADKTKAIIVADLTGMGYQLSKDSDFLLAFDRHSTAPVSILLASELYPIVNERVSLTIVPMDRATSVQVNLAFVTNPGSGLEMVTPYSINTKWGATIGPWLVGLPGEIQAAPAPKPAPAAKPSPSKPAPTASAHV